MELVIMFTVVLVLTIMVAADSGARDGCVAGGIGVIMIILAAFLLLLAVAGVALR